MITIMAAAIITTYGSSYDYGSYDSGGSIDYGSYDYGYDWGGD